MVICFTALYLNDTAQYELCTVQHARFMLATIVDSMHGCSQRNSAMHVLSRLVTVLPR